jgi:hypothetical protein
VSATFYRGKRNYREKQLMKRKLRKRAILAALGSVGGLASFMLFRSIPTSVGTATGIVVATIVFKHLALAAIVASPLTAMFQSVKPILRSHCPFAKP